MLYVQLDTNWPDHHKIIDAGVAGAGLHAVALCLAARSSDGLVSRGDLIARGATDALIDRLVLLRLLHEVNGDLTPNTVYVGGSTGRPHIPTRIRRAVMERDGRRCKECASPDDLSLDHIIPFSLGGPDTEENLRVLCRPCNSRKGNRV